MEARPQRGDEGQRWLDIEVLVVFPVPRELVAGVVRCKPIEEGEGLGREI